MEEQLPIIMLTQLVSRVAPDTEEGKDRVRKITKGIWRMAKDVLKAKTGADLDKVKTEADGSVIDVDQSELLTTLKDEFAKLCADRCGNDTSRRVVFFLDDLDRLLPERAIEVMEVLKNYMDVEYCVFVLAIDYNVVVKGLEAKFGLSVKQLGGRSFFDKIIQVPFRMPKQKYKLNEYVDKVLSDIGFPERSKEDVQDYVDLLKHSIGFNPRTIKRHANTLLLLRKVLENDEETKHIASDPHKLKLLFASLCMETAHRNLYRYLSGNLSSITLNNLSPKKLQGFMEDKNSDWPYDEDDPHPATSEAFCTKFFKIIDKNNDGNIDNDELNIIEEILGVSAIASVDVKETRAPGKRRAALNWDDFRDLADEKGVLGLYDKAFSELRPLFNGITRTRTNISIIGVMGKKKSRMAMIGIHPPDSSPEEGLVFTFYVDRLSKRFKIPEDRIQAFVDELSVMSSDEWQTKYFLNDSDLDKLIGLFRGSKKRR